MYKGAARVHFISAGKCKKSEILYITWVNVVGVIPFITVRAPERWERWERVPSQFEILAATFG